MPARSTQRVLRWLMAGGKSKYLEVLVNANVATDKIYEDDANMHAMKDFSQSIPDANENIDVLIGNFVQAARRESYYCINEYHASLHCSGLIYNLGIASHTYQDRLHPVHYSNGKPQNWYPGILSDWTNPLNWQHMPEWWKKPSKDDIRAYTTWFVSVLTGIANQNVYVAKELFE